MPLRTTGPNGYVGFQAGVKFDMLDDDDHRILVAVASEVLDFFEHHIHDGDISCFMRHRDRIERMASAKYDAGLSDGGRLDVAYADLKRL